MKVEGGTRATRENRSMCISIEMRTSADNRGLVPMDQPKRAESNGVRLRRHVQPCARDMDIERNESPSHRPGTGMMPSQSDAGGYTRHDNYTDFNERRVGNSASRR